VCTEEKKDPRELHCAGLPLNYRNTRQEYRVYSTKWRIKL
jgi:hypothetical protein